MLSQKYKDCYTILSLPQNADWETARARYRKLVQRWHPDRYAGANTKEAEKNFIEITSAFNQLRDYYNKNGEMPLGSSTEGKQSRSHGDSASDTKTSRDSYQHRSASSHRGARRVVDKPGDGIGINVDYNAFRHTRRSGVKPPFYRRPMVRLSAGIVVATVLGLTILMWLDMRSYENSQFKRLQHRVEEREQQVAPRHPFGVSHVRLKDGLNE